MRTILVALVVCPALAFAQGPVGGQGQQQGQGGGPGPQGQGGGPGQGRGMGPGMGQGPGRGDPERMEKRMRLARTLGLAEALDLDAAQALRVGETLEKFDARRQVARKTMHDARAVLQRAASGDKASAADVDGAIARIFEARAQLTQTDREMLQVISKDLPADKRARAALFLGRFEERIEKRVIMHGPGARGGPGAELGMRMGRSPRGDMGPGGPSRPGERRMMIRGGVDDEGVDLCIGEDCGGDEEF
jgi:hypothetical protein